MLSATLLLAVMEVSAQYRYPYPPPYPNRDQPTQQNVGRSGEIKQDSRVYQNRKSNLLLNLNYGLSQPLGSLNDYTKNTSFNGWNLSLLYQFNPKFAAGLGVGFYDYYQKIPRQLYTDKNSTISAVQTHTVQLIPIQPTALYKPKGGEKGIQPYVGLGVGIANVNHEKYWGQFVDKNNKISLSVSPMVGIKIPFGAHSPLSANVGVKYNYIPYKHDEISNINTVEGNVGISLHLR